MQLNESLRMKLSELAQNISLNELKKQIQSLSAQYRMARTSGIESLSSDRERLAYVLARMPATYATLMLVLAECVQRMPHLEIKSFLDVGTGPGTALWAMDNVFTGQIKKASLLERDLGFIKLGKQLFEAQKWSIGEVDWIRCDVTEQINFDSHDLVLALFSLGEMEEKKWQQTLLSMWRATKKILIVVEPGTPKGFERIRKMRGLLLDQHAHLMAPCPHSQECPMKGSDWCHFAARVERSSIHRQMKEGTLNYEDEKFSYCIFAREQIEPVHQRILSQPQKKSGYVNLKLCTTKGIEFVTISRKSKEEYRKARKSNWGDSI